MWTPFTAEVRPMAHHLDRRAEQLADLILSAGPADDLLSDKQMAEKIGVAPNYFPKLRSRGLGPASVTISTRIVRTTRQAWADWLRERAMAHAAD
jgi:hypothetical protein